MWLVANGLNSTTPDKGTPSHPVIWFLTATSRKEILVEAWNWDDPLKLADQENNGDEVANH